MSSPTPPRYKMIEEFLLTRIRNGDYPVNHQIPPEEQLARDFSVSRMTANKAINNLVQQGYLVRQAGLGTFVTDLRAESSLQEVMNIAEEVRARGHQYSNDVLRSEAVAADDEVALRLGLRIGSPVFHSILVHRENGLPIQLEDRYVNPRWVPHYLASDFSRQTPNEVLVANCPISDIEHVVEAIHADAQTARWLEIEPGAACLCMVRRTWSSENLVSYVRLTHPGERYKLRSTTRHR
ncbi:histidine utilization repressor [Pseudomonas sp. DTU_2021_1001937_2_SI_NGA_ILE_001]|uniref:histidine utilization repressor n=1 Tax=Pseudomonas sp. DTU_2021_1001937_2_SI_NGA_ILE_001 TaxID=3077589 RepID=UPI0025ED9AF2|nr:histidine utilization repressor [Pseudomonas sp. DTU_2021_1001937_2_SI_NGA_ILE_001]WNW09865.1 histidine utilization repressor [Pseudomonas sp. DTU_2021_1001937_2_SI_NGA_ILE_001]